MKNYRTAFIICLLLLIASLFARMPVTQAQAKDAPEPVAGRYAVASAQLKPGDVQVTVCDTLTGECWQRTTGEGWSKMGAPIR